MITLSQARKTSRLKEFSDQEIARGVPPIHVTELNALIKSGVKARQPQDQTSDFRVRGGSTGK